MGAHISLRHRTRHFGRESIRTGPSFHPKFQENFTMTLSSFRGVNDQCGAVSWALHETGMTPLVSRDNDMTAWLKHQYKGSGASGARGRPGDAKATSTGNSKYKKGLIPAHKSGRWLFNCNSRQERSSQLPVQKIFPLIFFPMKRV